MLTEQRFDIILKLLEEKKSVTVTELRELLDASESTVRRDITALDKAGKLTKVFGGAVALNHKVTAYEPTVAQKSELNKEEKQKIAKYAASLITPDDFVYLDAGTTTGLMLEYLAGVRAAFVTNAVMSLRTVDSDASRSSLSSVTVTLFFSSRSFRIISNLCSVSMYFCLHCIFTLIIFL